MAPLNQSPHSLSPSLRSEPEAPSATPEAPLPPEAPAAPARSPSGPDRLSMLLAADRQEGVEAGEMTEALTTVAWGLKQLGRASGGMASVRRARMSSAYGTETQTDKQTRDVRIQEGRSVAYVGLKGEQCS